MWSSCVHWQRPSPALPKLTKKTSYSIWQQQQADSIPSAKQMMPCVYLTTIECNIPQKGMVAKFTTNNHCIHLYRYQSLFNQLAPLDVIWAWGSLRSSTQTKINGGERSPMTQGIKTHIQKWRLCKVEIKWWYNQVSNPCIQLPM